MVQGNILWFNRRRGYGFIQTKRGDVWFHRSQTAARRFQPGDKVKVTPMKFRFTERMLIFSLKLLTLRTVAKLG